MIIAIDYDDTYTKDPLMWNAFIKNATAYGHKVYCVSMRPACHMQKVRDTIGQIIGEGNCFGTGLQGKDKWMRINHRIVADVWIDDNPGSIPEMIFRPRPYIAERT